MVIHEPEDEMPVCAYPLPPNGRSSAPLGWSRRTVASAVPNVNVAAM
jgi:hypothetical protein